MNENFNTIRKVSGPIVHHDNGQSYFPQFFSSHKTKKVQQPTQMSRLISAQFLSTKRKLNLPASFMTQFRKDISVLSIRFLGNNLNRKP